MDPLQSSDPRPQAGNGGVTNDALCSSFIPKAETGLRASSHKNREDFIPGWSTTLDTAREVGTKGERGGWWRECFRGSVCGLAYSLKLNGALLMGTDFLKSPEAFAEC